jgi:hypothetical protein
MMQVFDDASRELYARGRLKGRIAWNYLGEIGLRLAREAFILSGGQFASLGIFGIVDSPGAEMFKNVRRL